MHQEVPELVEAAWDAECYSRSEPEEALRSGVPASQ